MRQRTTTTEEYQRCVNVVIEYINNHLGEEIDLELLAEISHFSPYHFHRVMKAFLGEPLGAFIVRTRAEAAARLLRYSELPVADIAYRLSHRLRIALVVIEGVQAILWYFAQRVSKQKKPHYYETRNVKTRTEFTRRSQRDTCSSGHLYPSPRRL